MCIAWSDIHDVLKKVARLGLMILLLALPSQVWAQEPGVPPPGTIVIECDVPDSLVFVDHTMMGKAPITVTVAPGKHAVRVSAGEDYVPFDVEVDVPSGMSVNINAAMQRTSPALYRDAMAHLTSGDMNGAESLFTQAATATGKKAADIPFFLGLLAERRGNEKEAQRRFLAWVNISPTSATGQYHLGKARQALHQDALAATAFKSALTSGVTSASAVFASAGPPTSANIAHVHALSKAPGPGAARAALQLGYLYELKGNIAQARDVYRAVFESLMSMHHVNLDLPAPDALPVALPDTPTPTVQAAPANTLYITGDSLENVGPAWKAAASRHGLSGPVLVAPPINHWITLQAEAFDGAAQDGVEAAAAALSGALHTDVLYLQITADGRAWYFYWRDGRLLDQFCSNPGRPDEVDYKTLRAWSGKPDILVQICRGRPLSSTRTAPSVSDLNSILYYYYPELRQTRPEAYRSPSTFMKLLAEVVGLAHLPTRFANRNDDAGAFQPL